MYKQLLVSCALVAAAATAHADVTFGQNLILNGDAEQGVTGWTGFDGYSLFQSVNYGSNVALPTDPGPTERGASLFAGLGAQSAGFQLVELGSISTSTTTYTLTGWLGGWKAQGDNALLYASFLDAFNNELGFASLLPPTPEERGNRTGLLLRSVSGELPAGTASIMFSLSMERLGGGDNDGYADNLSFVLSPVPEASMLTYQITGLVALGGMTTLRRRRAPH